VSAQSGKTSSGTPASTSDAESAKADAVVVRFDHERLAQFTTSILARLGVPADDARTVADNLVLAELRGVDSHGLIRLPIYARRVRAGAVKANPAISVKATFPAVALVDGDNGLGAVVGVRAMDEAIAIARAHGTGFVGVRRSNHFGPAAFYIERALRAGMIGCAISNAPPNMAPFGGRAKFLGTNPFAVAIPTGEERPLVFDAATSVVARGKIIAAATRGASIPEGWAIDPAGRPTTDAPAALAGAVLPFGGPKGSAISFIIDIITGVLTGASFALRLNTLENLQAEQNIGHAFLAIRTDLFEPAAEFARRMDEIIRQLKASPPAVGIERVLVPGEIEHAAEVRYRAQGVPLPAEVRQQLVALGQETGVAFPEPRPASS
jgi:LDH2 family malate/lactate/ureidoglycolate dehydrogenase